MSRNQECIRLLKRNKNQIQKEFEVSSLSIFGSVARGEDNKKSDLDIFVDMPPKLILISELKEYLENLLSTTVDIIRNHSHLSTKFRSQIAHESIPVF